MFTGLSPVIKKKYDNGISLQICRVRAIAGVTTPLTGFCSTLLCTFSTLTTDENICSFVLFLNGLLHFPLLGTVISLRRYRHWKRRWLCFYRFLSEVITDGFRPASWSFNVDDLEMYGLDGMTPGHKANQVLRRKRLELLAERLATLRVSRT